jgi:hypothetical protein
MANSTTIYVGSDGRNTLDVTENKTLDLAGCGIVQNVITDAITITLPATTAGASFTIRNGGVPKTGGPSGTGDSGSVLVTVSPNASDKIQGNSFSASDDKDALNTKATANVGDEISITGDGTDGWLIRNVKGTWVRQG